MKKIYDAVFTATVLLALVTVAYFAYYLTPWRQLSRQKKRTNCDDPYAHIPFPEPVSKNASAREAANSSSDDVAAT